MPTISVIIPIYNKEMYLEKLWDDLNKQSFSDFECIIIDDGSTDNTAAMCDKAAEKYKYDVYHIKNGGVSHARNLGLEKSKCEYITFIDADDSMDKDYLKNLYECITKSKADMVIGSSLKVWNNSDREEDIMVPFSGLKTIDQIMPIFVENQLKNGIFGYCWGKLIKKESIGNIRFDEKLKLAEDLDFYLSIYSKLKNIYFDTKQYYFYLQEAENSSMLKEDKDIDYYSQLLIQCKMYRIINKMGYLYGSNKELILKRIYDYVYFTLFYAELKDLKKKYEDIKSLNIPPEVKNTKEEETWRRRIVLNSYNHNRIHLLKFEIYFYRRVRSFIRKIKGEK